MQVILLEKLPNLGKVGDEVKVKPGYGRNFLLPKGKALPATRFNREMFEAQRKEIEQVADEALVAAEERAKGLVDLKVSLSARASDDGRLFGSIRAADIAKALADQNIEVVRKEIVLPNGPIHTTGEHLIDICLHSSVKVTITLEVRAIEA